MARNQQNEEVAEVKDAAKGADEAHVDRVLAVSRHADGSPAQSPGFKSVDPERTAEISKRQLTEQSVSAVDHAIRSAQAETDGGVDPVEDPVNQALREAHESAASAGEKRAAGEKVEK